MTLVPLNRARLRTPGIDWPLMVAVGLVLVVGTLAWKFTDFPLDKVHIRGKTGSAEVHGKQSTSWVATYDKNYVVIMMVTQAGTGSGTSGPFVRKIWESLYGITGENVDPKASLIPGTTPPAGLPTFAPDGSILPPRSTAEKGSS